MNLNERVYCTNCQSYCSVWKSEDDVETSCKHELECDFSDSEDSKAFKDRPFYKSEFWVTNKEENA